MTISDIAKNFSPGWFGTVMGTGALALTTNAFYPEIALALHYLNLILFLLATCFWCYKVIAFREVVISGLNHPVQANFYPMFSIAAMVIANQLNVIQHAALLSGLLWSIGALIAIVFSFVLMIYMAQGEHILLDHVTPAIYLPAVSLVVVPVVGAHFVGSLSPEGASALNLLNFICLGTGFFMYLALLAMTIHRLVLHKRVQGPMVATVWINMAPLGLFPLAFFNLVATTPSLVELKPFIQFGSLMLVGFGLWWLCMAIMMTLMSLRNKELPFALSWWAFTFPLGALTLALQRLGGEIGFGALQTTAFVTWILLVCLWSVVLVNTIRGVRSGALLKG